VRSVVAMALPSDVAPIMIRFREAIIVLEEVFLRKDVRGEISSIGTQISMKAPICGGDFSTRLIEQSVHTTGIRDV